VKVTIFHNIARECSRCGQPLMDVGGQDDRYRWAHTDPGAGHPPAVTLANFRSYKAGHPLVRVFEAEIPDDYAADPRLFAEAMFEIGNAPLDYLTDWKLSLAAEYRRRQLRSVSVGDVVAVGETPLICASSGWQVLTGEVSEVRTGTDGSAPLRLPGPRDPRQNGDRQSSQARLPSPISVYTLNRISEGK
jgi:hypothetical protein